MATQFLAIDDLLACMSRAFLVKYVDDDGDGVVADDDPILVAVMAAAEGMYYTRMLRSWSRERATALAQNDPIARAHVAWIACELAAERRTEFTNSMGQGAYWAQYTRALAEIDLLSKGNTRTMAEGATGVGQGANTGGSVSSLDVDPPQFSYAPSRRNGPGGNGPSGSQGGFIWAEGVEVEGC